MSFVRRTIAIILVLLVIVIAAVLILLNPVPGIVSPPASEPFPVENLTISSGSPEFSSLTLVADKLGFFAKYGLNVTTRDYPSGVGAVNDLLSGNADLAYAAEFVGVNMINQGKDLKIIGSTAKSDVISLVARNDRGIVSPGDLKGKTIAVPKGTQAEFFLGRYLMLYGMNTSDVTIRYLAPADLEQSVVTGQSDAVVIWEPYVFTIGRQLGRNSTTFDAQGGQLFYWVTYTRKEVIDQKPAVLVRYFRALDDTEAYLYNHEAEGKAIIRKRVDLPDEYFDIVWEKTRFTLSLDQSLIIAMEDETRWMMNNNLTNKTVMPNYPDYISTDSLRAVKPDSVNIIE